ncbi:MAG: hypothetical protein AAGJ83_04505, partial [Planctomycetota bacterium]
NADLFNGAGGIAVGKSIGAGFSVSVDSIRRETQAIIGNLETELTQSLFSSVGAGVDQQDRIYLGYNHGLSDGDQVTYAAGGDAVIGGLNDSESYFVKLVDDSNNSGDPYLRLGRTFAEHTATFGDTGAVPGRNVINLGYVHGFQLGDAVRYQTGGSAAIGGLVEGQTYYVIPISPTTIALAADARDARASFNLFFDPADTVADNTLVFSHEHGYTEGQPLQYGTGGGTAIPGLVDGGTYYVHVIDPNVIELRTSPSGVTSIALGNAQDLGSTHTFTNGLLYSSSTVTGLNTLGSSNTIDLGYWHGYTNGQPLRYQTSGTTIGGLTNDTVYYAIVDGEQRIALATTPAEAYRGRTQFINVEDSIESDVIELEFDHGYQTGDAVVYSRSAFYSSSDNPTSPIFYTDASNNQIELVEGETYFAIRMEDPDDLIYNPDTDTFSPFSIGIKLALTQADALSDTAVSLDTTTATGVHAFHLRDSRIALTNTSADNSPQYFLNDLRVELSAASEAGTTHSLRLSLNPNGTIEETHGLGRVFTATADADATFNPATAVTGNQITQTHSFTTGDMLVYDDGIRSDATATEIGGLYRGQIVFAIVTGTNTFRVADSAANALAGTAITLDTSSVAGTAHTFRKTSISPTGIVDLGYSHGFVTGDKVVYSNGGGQSIGGLDHGRTFYVVAETSTSVRLAESAADAANGTTISLQPYFATGSQHGLGRVFRPTPVVDSGANTITFDQPHPYRTGDAVTYSSGSGTAIGGLTSGNTYYVIDVDGISLQLSATPGGSPINLDGTLATGSEHRIGTLSGDGSVVAQGTGAVLAQSSGDIISVTLAGSVITRPDPGQENLNNNNQDGPPAQVVDRKFSVSESASYSARDIIVDLKDVQEANSAIDADQANGPEKRRTSRSIAGAVSVHVINDTTRAIISDSNVTFRSLDVDAFNDSKSIAITGALAIASGNPEAEGIAGAISVSVIDNETYAIIEGSIVNVLEGDLNVDAGNDSDIITVAMGAAGVSGAKALAGSVVVNAIGSEAHAKIRDGSEVIVLAAPGVVGSGKAAVASRDENTIISIAGAGGLAFGAGADKKTGVGAAVNVNVIDPREGTTATIEDSDLSAEGVAIVDADVANIVTPITVALATALGGTSPKSLAAAVSVGVVVVDGTTRASARRRKNQGISGKGGVRIEADDNSVITTVSGGVALAGSLGG